MYNKSQVKKMNDRKVLHKVGKSWKVISLALLMAIGGTAVATHAANADTIGDNSSNNVSASGLTSGQQSQIKALTASNAVNPEQERASVHLNPGQKSPASSATVIHYWDTNAGSAASYHNAADNDAKRVNHYGSIVNSYVSNIKQQYPKQTRSLADNYESLNNKATHESTLASSYRAIANNKNNSNVLKSLAQQAHLYPTNFVGSVATQATTNSSNIKSYSNEASQLDKVASYATLISNISTNPESKAVFENRLATDQYKLLEASATDNDYKAIFNDTINNFTNANKSLASITNAINANNNASVIASDNKANDANTAMSIADNRLGHLSIQSTEQEALSLGSNLNKDDNQNTAFDFTNSNGATVPLSGADIYALISDATTDNNYASVSSTDSNELGAFESNFKNYSGVNSSFNSEMNSADAAYSSASENYAIDSTIANKPSLGDIFGINNNAQINTLNGEINKDTASQNDAREGIANLQNDVAAHAQADYSATTDAFNNDMQHYVELLNANQTPFNASNLRNAMLNNTGNAFNSIYSLHTNGHYNDLVDYLTEIAANGGLIDGKKGNYNYTNPDKGVALQAIDDWLVDYTPIEDNQITNDSNAINNDETKIADLGNAINGLKAQQANLAKEDGSHALMGSNNSAEARDIVGNWINDANVTQATSAINSLASSANTQLSAAKNAQSSFMSGSSATFVLALSLANSYSTEAKSDGQLASNAKNSLENFYVSAANDPDFNTALANYKQASHAYQVNSAYAQAYGINVWNRAPKKITIVKNCQLHTNVTFGSRSDRIVQKLHKGGHLTVLAIGLDRKGTLRYLVRDKKTGREGYVTGMRNYIRPTYLKAQNDTSVIALSNLRVYRDPAFRKKTHKIIKAGRVINGVNIIRESPWNDGFTRIELSNGEFVTARTKYVKLVDNRDNAYYYGRKHAGSKFLGYGFNRSGHEGRDRYSSEPEKPVTSINWL